MRLIKRIEIKYLRSLYTANVTNCGDMNVVFGRNDSGKSNLLRALNLFFNNATDNDRDLDFELDMSDIRKGEARRAQGRQFISVKITFTVPKNFQKSLGEEVTIKKQWNRDGDVTETIWPSELSKGELIQLTKFRNQIDFSYIPAIKDLEVYADLIERMYGAAAETEILRNATGDFVNAIQGQTTELSTRLSDIFGNVALAPPTEMSRLFRNLDFAHGEEGHSLLRQKGDGVKARHIPELLRFINSSESGKKFFIWGFEEPENSLDLGAADTEAARFKDFSSRNDTQVFVTSHSAAFYLSSSSNNSTILRRYFISKQIAPDEGSKVDPVDAVSAIDSINEAESKMEAAGLLQLPFIIRSMNDLQQDRDKIAAERDALEQRMSQLRAPTLFVEGAHDVNLFQAAFRRLGVQNITVQDLGGTPSSASSYIQTLEAQGRRIAGAPTLFLFDNDKAGRNAHRQVAGRDAGESPVNIAGNVSAWTLPYINDFQEFLVRMGLRADQGFFTAEFLIPADAAAALCLELINRATARQLGDWREKIHGDYWPSAGQTACKSLMDAPEGTADWFYARGVPASLKERFAQLTQERRVDFTHIDDIATRVQNYLIPQ